MNIEIAIPSYDRAYIIKEKTLKLLERFNVPKSMIRIFLKDEEELEKYIDVLGNDYTFVLTGQGNIQNTRNFLRKYYQNSSLDGVLFIDDDIDGFTELGKPLSQPFLDIIQYFFKETRNRGFRYFGVNPSFNPFYWKDQVKTHLKYILGGFAGLLIDNTKDLIQCDIGHYEDYQFTIEHFIRDGGIVCFEKYGIHTKRIQASGGITGSLGGEAQRDIERDLNADFLENKYPGMIKKIIKDYGKDVRLNWRFKPI